jgi:O-antigen/teichoic acid export membrane protein
MTTMSARSPRKKRLAEVALAAMTIGTNLATQIVGILCMIATVPFYLRLLGAEAFGVVALGNSVQAWLMLFDFGVGVVLVKIFANYGYSDAEDAMAIRSFDAVETFLFAVGSILVLVGVPLLAAFAPDIIQASTLAAGTLRISLILIVAIAGVRIVGNAYRGMLIALERQISLNAISSGALLLRYFGVLPLIWAVPDLRLYFVWHLFIVIIENVALRAKLGPHFRRRSLFTWDPSLLRSLLPISGNIMGASVLSATAAQADKLILAPFVSLLQYAAYSLAAVMGSGVGLIATAVTRYAQPKLVRIGTTADRDLSFAVYRTTKLVIVGTLPITIVTIAHAELALRLWAQRPDLAAAAAPYASWYLAAGFFTGIQLLVFNYVLARGALRLHLIGTTIFCGVYILLLYVLAAREGALGAAHAVFIGNALFALAWPLIVYSRIERSMLATWCVRILLLPSVAAIAALLMVLQVESHATTSRELLRAIVEGVAVEVLIVLVMLLNDRIFWRRSRPLEAV